jgi:hypothetical protein
MYSPYSHITVHRHLLFKSEEKDFSSFLNLAVDSHCLMSFGSEFHGFWAMWENALTPMVLRFILGILSRPTDREGV